MLGLTGALVCLAAGFTVGMAICERHRARLHLLECYADVLSAMRLWLTQERMPMGALLLECEKLSKAHAQPRIAERFARAADALSSDPLSGVAGAWQQASVAVPLQSELPAEREAWRVLFLRLGSGTAEMREQAVATCLRRLRPLTEEARRRAERSGKLSARLGLLLGLMAGIILW